MKLTKKTYRQVLNLIANHGEVDRYAANADDCRIDFTQKWPRESTQCIERGDYITSENSGLRVYTSRDFDNRFAQVYHMSDYFHLTDNEVKVIESLGLSNEYCYSYDSICSDTELTRQEAKEAVDRLRLIGVVEYHRGLMDEDGGVQGSGFSVGDRLKAEALLFRHYGEGKS